MFQLTNLDKMDTTSKAVCVVALAESKDITSKYSLHLQSSRGIAGNTDGYDYIPECLFCPQP